MTSTPGTSRITYLDHEASAGLSEEMAVLGEEWTAEKRGAYLDRYPTLADFLGEIEHAPEWLAVAEFARDELAPNARVLDVGVGHGRSSLLLTRDGFRVTAVEPVPEMCLGLEEACERYGTALEEIVCAPAEALDQLPAESFDAVVFNASFHHLDEVDQAMRSVHRLLVPGGKVALANEPVLPFFASKARWLKKMEENPEAMGHYGGNEHTYHHGEYVEFLRRAGFTVSARLNVRYRDYVMMMRQIANREINGVPVYSPNRLLARAVVLALVSKAASIPAAVSVMQRGSLVASTFVGTKAS